MTISGIANDKNVELLPRTDQGSLSVRKRKTPYLDRNLSGIKRWTSDERSILTNSIECVNKGTRKFKYLFEVFEFISHNSGLERDPESIRGQYNDQVKYNKIPRIVLKKNFLSLDLLSTDRTHLDRIPFAFSEGSLSSFSSSSTVSTSSEPQKKNSPNLVKEARSGKNWTPDEVRILADCIDIVNKNSQKFNNESEVFKFIAEKSGLKRDIADIMSKYYSLQAISKVQKIALKELPSIDLLSDEQIQKKPSFFHVSDTTLRESSHAYHEERPIQSLGLDWGFSQSSPAYQGPIQSIDLDCGLSEFSRDPTIVIDSDSQVLPGVSSSGDASFLEEALLTADQLRKHLDVGPLSPLKEV